MPKPTLRILALTFCLALAIAGCRDESKESFMAEAAKLVSQGNTKGAVVVYKSMLERYPDDPAGRFELAKSYLEIGKPEQAEKEISRLASLPNPPEQLRLVSGKIKLASRNPNEAVKEFETYLGDHPESAEAWEFLGYSLVQKNNLPEAARAFEQALANNPGNSKAKLSLAEARLIMGQLPESKALITELLAEKPNDLAGMHLLAQVQGRENDNDAMLETYSRIVAAHPDDMRARYNEAFLLLNIKGDVDAAEKAAAKLMAQFPNQAEGYKLQGLVEFKRKAFSQAVTSLQRAVKLRPDMENHYLLALAYDQNGNLETAVSELRIVLDNVPRSVRARQLMASLHQRLNRTDEAIAELEKLLSINPEDSLSKRMLGDIYLAREDFDKSLEFYGSVLDGSDQSSTAHFKKGVILADKNKPAEAEAELRMAASQAPGAIEPRIILATVLQRQQRLDDAMAVLEAPGLSGTNSAIALNAMANIRFHQNRVDDMMALMEQAKAAAPKLATTYHNLARYYMMQKQPEKALEQFNQFLAQAPGDPRTLTAMASISENMGKPDEALQYLKQAAETKQLDAYLNLATYLARKGKNDDALKVLDECLAANQNALVPMILKTRVHSVMGDETNTAADLKQLEAVNREAALTERLRIEVAAKRMKEAETVANRFIEFKPQIPESYLPLASTYEVQGKYADAAATMRRALDVDRNSASAKMKLGSILMKTGDTQEAIRLFDDVIANTQKPGSAFAARGTARQMLGDLDGAVKDYEAALLIQNNVAMVHNNLAMIYADSPGRAPKALEHAVAAYTLENGNPSVMDTLGYALLRNGRSKDALAVLTCAAELAPDNQDIIKHMNMAKSAKQ